MATAIVYKNTTTANRAARAARAPKKEAPLPASYADAARLDGALGGALDVSAPRAPVDFHFTGKEVVKSADAPKPNTYALVDDPVAGDSGYASDATLGFEGEYTYERPEDRARALRKRGASDKEVIIVSDGKEEAADAAPAVDTAPAAPVVDAAAADDDAEPRQQRWSGAVPPRPRSVAPRAPKKLRVALPTGDRDATLAHSALYAGFVGGNAEGRRALIQAARELRGASERWAKALETKLNELVPAGAPLFSFGAGPDDDLNLRGSGKGLTKHAGKIVAALTDLRDKNAAWAAENGVLVQWPDTLPRCIEDCAVLKRYLDDWAASVY
jgi:hypothetical protein